MKQIDRRLFATGIIRLLIVMSAVWASCLILTSETKAQTVLPIVVELLNEQKETAEPDTSESVRLESGISNLDNALAELWRANFSLDRSDVCRLCEGVPDDEKQKRKAQTDAASASGPAQVPTLSQSNDRRWRNPDKFNWDGAFRQSFYFLGIQHAFRLATEQGTRAGLNGPFFKDYFRTLRSLRGWDDGDPFLVNYIGHPMMGSVTGFIQVQNDPKGISEELSLKKSYWKSRMKAMGWSFVYSTQFELGLISEASVGNIGMLPNKKSPHPMAYVDLVVTPVVGTGWLVGEDALDKYFIRRVENRIPNRATIILFRSFLNPTRSFANMMRGKWPWYRDNRK